MRLGWKSGLRLLVAAAMICQVIGLWGNSASAAGGGTGYGSYTIKQVVTGDQATYALDDAGQLWSWGRPAQGDRESSAPHFEEKLTAMGLAEIAGGAKNLLVRTKQGEIWLWNGEGIQKADVKGVTSLYVHNLSVYMVMQDATVWGWSLDLNNKNNYLKPGRIDGIPGPVAKIEASYALLTDGSVYDISLSGKPRKTGLTGISSIVQGAAGCYIALKTDGTVVGWGFHWQPDGSWVLTSDGGTYYEEMKPAIVPGLDHVRQISGGQMQFAALKEDGSVYVWGQNYSKQMASKGGSVAVPTAVAGLPPIASLADGFRADHVAVIDNQGKLWVWGSNKYGQLGYGSTGTDSAVPQKVNEVPKVESAAASPYSVSYDGVAGNGAWAWATDEHGGFLALTERQALISSDHGNSWSSADYPYESNIASLVYAKDRYYLLPVNSTDKAYWTKDGREWKEMGKLASPVDHATVQWVNGHFVLNGEDRSSIGTTLIYTSDDGETWEQTGKVSGGGFSGVYWNGSAYVGLGYGYQYYGKTGKRNQFALVPEEKRQVELLVYTSTNLSDWTQQSGFIDNSLSYKWVLNGVPRTAAFTPRQSGGSITFDWYDWTFRSVDGITFTSTAQNAALKANKIDSFSGPFTVGGRQLIFGIKWRDEGIVLASSDGGKTWKKQAIKGAFFGMQVVWTGKQFVGFSSTDGLIAVSANGVDWSAKRGPYPYANIGGVAKSGGTYTAVGSEFQLSVPSLLRSKDGRNWTFKWSGDRYSSDNSWLESAAAFGSGYVAVGDNQIWLSKDGSAWTSSKPFGSSVHLHKVVAEGNSLYAIGDDGYSKNTSFLAVSTNGKTWTRLLTKAAIFQDVAVHGSKIAISGYQGKGAVVFSTADRKQWKTVTIASKGSSDLQKISVQWVNNRFVAIGDFMYGSSDGVTWTSDSSGLASVIQGDSWSNGFGRMLWTGSAYWYVSSGLYGVADASGQWSLYNTGLAGSRPNGIMQLGNGVLAYGDGGLLLRISPK